MATLAHGRACGKVILFGEHAVVYGAPALAAALSIGAKAEVTASDRDEIRFDDGPALESEHALLEALRIVRERLGLSPVSLRLQLEIPAGSGLGGSAALGVATVRALAGLLSRPLGDESLLATIDAWENVFHGNASGVDARAAYYGGLIRFVRGRDPERINLPRPLDVVVAIAAPPASTKAMVEQVARIKATRGSVFDKAMAGITALSENAYGCLRSGDVVGLGKLMDLNHMLLGSLLLSTEALENACATAREHGALGAKLTGSGGGGAIVALTGPDPEPVRAALERAGFPAFSATISTGIES